MKNRVNYLWEINETNLSLTNLPMKGWEEFLKNKKNSLSSIMKKID